MTLDVVRQPADRERHRCRVRISGGLGNQLFQYAAGRALALRTGAELELDVSFYDCGRHRSLELDQLPICGRFSRCGGGQSVWHRCRTFFSRLLTRDPVYREPHFHYDPAFEALCPPVTLEGYFQSERYFAAWKDQLCSELTIPQPTDELSVRLARKMDSQNSTALHIRRGDYLTNAKASQIYAVCSLDYYRQAMERIPGNDPVYVFSDDLAWVREHLPPVKPLVFVDDVVRPALADLWLMTRCRHHIIANSSFSWWGAWLAVDRGGLTIAPAQWFRDQTVKDGDLIPAHWIRLASVETQSQADPAMVHHPVQRMAG